MLTLVVSLALLSAPEAGLPDSYLARVERALELGRGDIGSMEAAADAAAGRLANGGVLYAAGQPSVVSELCGRAGGMMMNKRIGKSGPGKKDVIIYAASSGEGIPQNLADSGGLLVVLGAASAPSGGFAFAGHAGETGLSSTIGNAITGWLFTGELIAGLTRVGKMPVIYASIGTYQGFPRIRKYEGVSFHETHKVPKIPAGQIANAYVDTVTGYLKRVKREEAGDLARAAAWAAEAKSAGKRVIMYSMGHLFPAEVAESAIGKVFESGVWNSGFFAQAVPNDTYNPGDVCIHIGYQHPPYRLLDRAIPSGARVAYVDVMAHRDYVDNPNVIRIDPMWPWLDGCVPLEGYDVPLLASSGVVNGAIAWEIYRLTEAASK